VIGAAAFMVAAVTIGGTGIHLSTSQASFRENPKELVDEVWQLIDRVYLDATFNQVDWRTVRKEYLSRDYSNQEEAYQSIRDMLDQLGDPYTRFMDPQEFKNMQIDTSGELTGVGIQLSQNEETKQFIVVSPIEDTPAFNAGVQAQDVIVAIDGQSTEGMDIDDVVNLIRGPVGTSVTLSILRDEQEQEFRITRDRIEIHPVRFKVREEPMGKIGYIRLTQFSSNAAAEMRDAIKELEDQSVIGYVLDLRSNPGGLLRSSIEITRMWLESGTIVSTVDRNGEVDRERANRSALTQKPLVVIIDGGSASASEILSGALQDHERATLIGTQTFGKGLVQSVRPLGDSSGLAVTVAKYLTPSGRDINKLGITPDTVVELTDEEREALIADRTQQGTLQDPQYAKAIDILYHQVSGSRRKKGQEPQPGLGLQTKRVERYQ